ncbi:diguanylate cyclase (GGDEF) domain-containing protein [Ectothiorhodospira magna]|uniref:diguanylate cyclase n=1 Tax=Ectothiorhodospira magna TaxID=867345 RepID=A0A1H9DNA6_9GAMM|nr:GGDEF domain-containing protein [Ectothiorhodospira magna]SEQ14777.1 diguanylate cyclase (GGDEF) domain-containing protein [Ectothiorhodospira magna]
MPKILHPNIHTIYLVVIISSALLTASFYWVGFKPLADRLREGHALEIAHGLQSTQWLVQGVLDRHFALAHQTASRSAIREKQVAYLEGQHTLEALQTFTAPKLEDALRANQELLGIHRKDPLGQDLVSVGVPLDPAMTLHCPQPGQTQLQMLGPASLGGLTTLLYCSPIKHPEQGLAGWDILVMDAGALYRILEQPQRHDLRTMTFSITDHAGHILFWPQTLEHAHSWQVLLDYLEQDKATEGFMISVISLARSNWQVVAVVDEQRFFAETNRQLMILLGVVGGMVLLVLVLTVLVLRPIIRALVRARELGREIQLDGMTGLYHHAYMQQLLSREIARVRRYGNAFSVLMFDLDHFKRINDTHGHPVGDQVLLQIADTVRQLARNSDLAARYGGEEFMLIMPQTHEDGALMMAQRLLEAVNGQPFVTAAGPIPVTISIGVVTCPEGGSPPSREQLIQEVDSALYTSKRTGRNRITQKVIGQGEGVNPP